MWRKRLAALALGAMTLRFGTPGAGAAIETDPAALYATMKTAYDTGTAHGWKFGDEQIYLGAILDAGRSYSLFNPTDPQYAEVATLTVDVCTQLHYDPLTNNDASAWYVREAATYVAQHGDPAHVAAAGALLARVEAGDTDPKLLAQQAEADALANAKTFASDPDALVQTAVADARAYNLTQDAHFRSLLLAHAADAAFPLARVPDPELPQIFGFVRVALSGENGYTPADVRNARAIDDRRAHTPELRIIGRTYAIPSDVRLTRTAPADEYFGRLKISPLGVHNELVRINKYLDVGWGTRMASDAINVEDSVVDWQRQYPRDRTLPQHLYDVYALLKRVGADTTLASAGKIRNLLLVQYASSPQAQELASS